MQTRTIVILDAKTIGDDIDLSPFHTLGMVHTYGFSSNSEIPERVKDADVIITNKCRMNAATLQNANQVKLICVTATGTNNLDKEYLAERGIAWRNVAGYSTDSVAQHTFAMLFYLLEKLKYYDDYVKSGQYMNDTLFTHFSEHFTQISGKTWGIIGLGDIGRKVTDIARVFGASVIYYSASGQPPQEGYTQVDLDTLLRTSDIVSVHAPLNAYTEGLMNEEAFAKMKPSSIFLNLGRGAIVVEEALYHALEDRQIMAAGIDVLCQEPMSPDNPLAKITDSRKLLITPHIAWASVEARTTLMKIVYQQIQDFFHH